MTTGYVLILAVLILGGVIATLGDRIGTRVGKARLSLFRLRPRQTAILVSTVTGSIISATTLGLLFAVNRQLRTGVFELEKIQANLAQAKTDLADAQATKADIEAALIRAREQQQVAQADLKNINQFLREAVDKQQATQADLQRSQAILTSLREQLGTVSEQAQELRGEIQRLESERAALLQRQNTIQREITQRDQQIAERDRQLVERNQQIAQRESLLQDLETQQTRLQADISTLEKQYEGLFRGSVVVSRNEPLVAGLLRVTNPQVARQTVDQLLRQANRVAIQEIAPGTDLDRQVLLVSQEEVDRLIDLVSDQQTYVVRIVSEANYIIGEPCVVAEADPCVQVYIDAVLNDIIYAQGEKLAMVTVNPATLSNQELVERLSLLITSMQLRARQDGVVGDTLQIADGRTEAIAAFLGEIRQVEGVMEIQAIATEPIFAIGPLRVELFAVQNNRILSRTDELPRSPSQAPTLTEPR
jgi:uncharacterized protein (DUF3084 family)